MASAAGFELRAQGDRAKYDRMREIARERWDAAPFFT